MNHIKYLIAKTRLFYAHCRVAIAKDYMTNLVCYSRGAYDEITTSYDTFLKWCKQQEKAAIALKRLQCDADYPILDIDLGVEHFLIRSNSSGEITRMDAEVAVTRHRYGDWGEVTLQNWRCNNTEVSNPYGIIRSRYPLHGGGYFIVETDKRKCITEVYLDGEQ